MELAKPRVDIGLSTNDLEPMLAFWQGPAGVPFDHLLKIRRESVTLGKTRKVGLGRVLDGTEVLELLKTCTAASSFRRGNARPRSSKKR